MNVQFILKAKSPELKKNVSKKLPNPTKNEVLEEKRKIVVHMVNLELVHQYELDQILKHIRVLVYTKLYE